MPVGSLAVLGAGDTLAVVARTAGRLMLLGGEPLGDRFLYWNFVSSRRDRLEQAKEDWRQGRFAMVPGDDSSVSTYIV